MKLINKSVQMLCCSIFLLSFIESNAQIKNATKREMRTNPVLLLEYDISKVKYEQFPITYIEMCAKELSGEKYRRIYARIRSGESEYLANMGVWNSNIEDYNEGDLILIKNNKCEMFGIGGALMALPPKNGYHKTTSKDTLPWFDSPNECVNGQCHLVFRSIQEEQLMRSFVRDAIQRAITAYGGDVHFRVQACKPEEEKELSEAGFSIVLQELKAYCSKAP